MIDCSPNLTIAMLLTHVAVYLLTMNIGFSLWSVKVLRFMKVNLFIMVLFTHGNCRQKSIFWKNEFENLDPRENRTHTGEERECHECLIRNGKILNILHAASSFLLDPSPAEAEKLKILIVDMFSVCGYTYEWVLGGASGCTNHAATESLIHPPVWSLTFQ